MKNWILSNEHKKTVLETIMFTKGEQTVEVSQWWRTGEWLMENEDKPVFSDDENDMSDYEVSCFWDGVDYDLAFTGFSEEEEQKLREEIEEDGSHWVLEDNHSFDAEVYYTVYGPVNVEEAP